jgi:hypothetical protein
VKRSQTRSPGALVLALGLSLGLVACSTAEPVVPREIYQSANQSDRVWVYKATWQDTRALVVAIEGADLSEIGTLALVLTARLDRLDDGKAGPLRDRQTAELMHTTQVETGNRTVEANLTRLRELGQQIQEHFDDGDFTRAKTLSLEALALSRTLLAN